LSNIDVLFICNYLGEFEAGYRRVKYFFEYLRSKGLRTRCIGVIHLTSYGIIRPSKECYEVPLSVSSSNLAFLPINFINYVLSFSIIPLILILKPRVVVVSIPDSHILLASYIGSLMVGSRIIVDIRDPQEKLILISYKKGLSKFVAKAYKLINHSLYKRASSITVTTRTLVEWMTKDIGKQVNLIPNGADLRIFKAIDKREARTKLGLNQGSLLIAYIGLLSSRGYYNILPLLMATRKIRRKLGVDVKLVVAGPIYDGVVKRIIDYFKEEVTYMGVLDVKGVITLLSASDIGVIPRVGDAVYDYAIPAKFYEYVATGLPMIVLARKRSELGEVIEKNKLGFLCEPRDHICLEKVIETLALNRGLLDELRKNVLEFKKYVDRRIGAERLLKLIIWLIQDDKFDARG